MKTDVKLICVFVLLAVLSSCAPVQAAPAIGEVVSLAPSTVAYGIRAALLSAPGTSILTDGAGRYLFVWCYQNASAGFFAIDAAGNPLQIADTLRKGGNLVNSGTVTELVTGLQNNNWVKVAPGAVPAALVELAGARMIAAPVLILTVGTFPGGFDNWFNATFYAKEVQG